MASSAIYSADLAGSALGFILISGFAVPAFGIQSFNLFIFSFDFCRISVWYNQEQIVVLLIIGISLQSKMQNCKYDISKRDFLKNHLAFSAGLMCFPCQSILSEMII